MCYSNTPPPDASLMQLLNAVVEDLQASPQDDHCDDLTKPFTEK